MQWPSVGLDAALALGYLGETSVILPCLYFTMCPFRIFVSSTTFLQHTRQLRATKSEKRNNFNMLSSSEMIVKYELRCKCKCQVGPLLILRAERVFTSTYLSEIWDTVSIPQLHCMHRYCLFLWIQPIPLEIDWMGSWKATSSLWDLGLHQKQTFCVSCTLITTTERFKGSCSPQCHPRQIYTEPNSPGDVKS